MVLDALVVDFVTGEIEHLVWRAWREKRPQVLVVEGQESLLSLALLREAGREAHPVFINESGAHWLTALNSYRHLLGEDTGTARVWTVAVFSFGALPVHRLRGLGNLVIGDEHDTTRRSRLDGILHYDGLFDQSRYFDLASSRYFQRKGWGVTQRSLVRPLSELLVQRVLALRYPRLQEQQTSCHSARMRGRRAVPGGRCEKCSRVVGMLLATGADPRRCGYTAQQVDRCLRELTRTALRQEEETARRTLHLLRRRGPIPQAGAGPGGRGAPVRNATGRNLYHGGCRGAAPGSQGRRNLMRAGAGGSTVYPGNDRRCFHERRAPLPAPGHGRLRRRLPGRGGGPPLRPSPANRFSPGELRGFPPPHGFPGDHQHQ